MKTLPAIDAVDLFCGAGGTSEGLVAAVKRLQRRLKLLAINHWVVAIDTHATNHAEARNLCTGLDVVDPHKLVPGRKLDLLCASPECTHHSVARGGKPMDDQSRSSAWMILRWVQQLYIKVLVFENVPEWEGWGPLGANGKPLKSKKGELFQAFVATLRALGYKVEWKVLNCADYGSPTTRRRLFMICRRDGRAITWPAETHISPAKERGLFDAPRKPWRTAREVIDWSLKSRSIFGRKKSLADNTLTRIEAGLLRFNGIRLDLWKCMRENLRPYLIVPPGQTMAEAEAFLLPHRTFANMNADSIHTPLRTITANSADFCLVKPFLVDPNFGERKGQTPRVRSVDRPAPTVTASGAGGVVEPFLTVLRGTGTVASVDKPVPTVTANGNHYGAVQPYIVTVNHGEGLQRRVRSVDQPMATVTGSLGEVIAIPALIKFYRTGTAVSVDEPLDTITTKERFGLMVCELIEQGYGIYLLDIHFRMLQPRELARAQGFPDTYQFKGTKKEIVKQIGNAVPPDMAEALIYEVLKPTVTGSRGIRMAA